MPEPLDPLVKMGRENERLKLANAELRSLNRKLMRRGGGYDHFMQELREVLATDKKFKYKPRDPGAFDLPPIFDPTQKETAAVLSSDLHLAEEVRREESNGINVYTPVIAANKLWAHAQDWKQKIRQRQALLAVEDIWLMFLGDMISGTIHPDQVRTNSLSDPASVILATRLLYMFVEELLSLGLPITVDCVHGNHPRTTIKMPTKRQAHSNLDWLIYEQLADKYDGHDQIKFSVHTGQIAFRMMRGWRFLLEHGIDVKSGKEEQFESRLRDLFDDPVYRKATGTLGPAFDQVVIGNMHKEKFLERTTINGAYVGQNELGQSWRLKPIHCSQVGFFISDEQPRTMKFSTDLTSVTSKKADNPMSEYAIWFMKRHGNW